MQKNALYFQILTKEGANTLINEKSPSQQLSVARMISLKGRF